MKVETYDSFFGIPLTTHRARDPASLFLYELAISAIAVIFFRTTIYQSNEPFVVRAFFTAVLAFLAYTDQSYELICAVEIFSYAFSFCCFGNQLLSWVLRRSLLEGAASASSVASQSSQAVAPSPVRILSSNTTLVVRVCLIAVSAVLALVSCHVTANGDLFRFLALVTPGFVVDALSWMFPVDEVAKAYEIMDHFVDEPGVLEAQCARLLFITFHIQVGMGYLGIHFLNEEQHRRNQLVRMDMIGSDDTKNDEAVGSSDSNSDSDSDHSPDKKRSNENTNKNDAKPPNITPKQNKSSSGAVVDGAQPVGVTPNVKRQRANRFQRSALPFILFTAVPYMVQIISYGNINSFAFTCFKDEMHRAVRLHELFEHDNHLVAMATHSAKAPQAYGDYMSTVVSTTYDIFNRKLFSLPKILLLPGMIAKQPQMVMQIFPIIFVTDWLKGKAIAYMTNRIETLEKETQQLNAIRSKVEAFDIKNAELLQRSGPNAINFTGRRWEDLTVAIQTKAVVKDLITRTKNFFRFIHRNFVFVVLVDCALAHLISVGKIVAAEIFVFSRAIEDAVDMVLMRSRSEAELARLMTQIDNLKELSGVWQDAQTRNTIPCNLASPKDRAAEGSMVVLRNLQYSRGTANVRIDHLELRAGVYALTGANGSGKSTLFRVLMSCSTNERSIDLPPSIIMHTPAEPFIEADDLEREVACEAADENATDPDDDESAVVVSDPTKLDELHPRLSVTMPSSRVVEISQTFYWPLYSKPLDWIYQEDITDASHPDDVRAKAEKVAEELYLLEFSQTLSNPSGDHAESKRLSKSEVIESIINDLLEEKEDWFGDLSGGQKSKVELVRKVFLYDECPHVLLIDETMAPLDPSSKIQVMARLKSFCRGSVMIVIYHTDVGQEHEMEDGEVRECVPGNEFFDGNIHVENQRVHLRTVCQVA